MENSFYLSIGDQLLFMPKKTITAKEAIEIKYNYSKRLMRLYERFSAHKA